MSSTSLASKRNAALILKEEYLDKYAGRFIKTWHKRYFVLAPQSLCYFKVNEDSPTATAAADKKPKDPRGRLFLATITEISLCPSKKREFAFIIRTGMKQKLLLAASSEQQMCEWIDIIKSTREREETEEKTCKFRQSLRRLKADLKRVSLVKEGGSIGCTIKIAGGPVLVNRILPDGPIAQTGVLKPGDQILDIHGKSITGLSMEEVVKVIRDAPTVFIATIRPTTSIQRPPVDPHAKPTSYAVLDYDKMSGVRESRVSNESVGEFNEPGLSSDEHSEEDLLNPDHSQTDTAGIKQSRLETRARHAPDQQSRAGSGSEKALSSKPVYYAELEWGNEGVKEKTTEKE